MPNHHSYTTAYHTSALNGKTVLITGGAGFIGSHIAQYLLEHGIKVVVIDNFCTGFRENVDIFLNNPNYTFIEGDISDLDTCFAACQGVDIICHQAALGSVPRSVKEPHNTTLNNVNGFVNMCVAARDSGIKRFVYASSSSVYGDEKTLPKVEHRIGNPLSPYAITKLSNELFATNFATLYGIDFIGFRYFNVFGPRQSPRGVYAAVIPLFVEACMKGEPAYLNGDGEMTRDFTFVENVVQMNVRAMCSENPDALNQIYNVGCNERISVKQLFELIREFTNGTNQAIHREARAGDIRDSLADISKAETLLHYKPLFKHREGLKITVDSFL
jgi:UDP-N-acetylglucosamine/UDP-N-acetylgalactosamine 4-epimerase